MNRILIADDNEDLLEIFKITLEDEGYEVQTSSNKRDLFSLIKSFTPDLLILDVFLNNIDGRVICRELKKNSRTRDLPVIMCSANPYAIAGYKSCGAADAIEKPLEIPVLLQKIEHILGVNKYRKAS